jgi:hypothetical protein
MITIEMPKLKTGMASTNAKAIVKPSITRLLILDSLIITLNTPKIYAKN